MKAGWEIKTFENVLEIKNGRNQKAVQKENGQYPIYGSAGNVMGWTDDYICEAGTTIVGRKGTINNPIYTETKFWNVDTAFGLSPKEFLDSKFLHYFCISYDFSEHNRGTTIPSLVKTDLLQIRIPLPPLLEQKRLVTLLDETFKSIATAKANAQQNLKNARALFESHLHEVFTKRGVGYVEKRLGDVCTLQRGFDLPVQDRVSGDFPLVSSSGITDTHNVAKVKAPAVITGRSGSIGKVFYIENDCWALNTTLYVKDFHGNSPRMVYYLLKQFDLTKFASGTGVPTLNRNNVHDEFVTIPEFIAEQNIIVSKLDTLSEETQRLEALYSRKIAALDELKKALLHRAFSGEL